MYQNGSPLLLTDSSHVTLAFQIVHVLTMLEVYMQLVIKRRNQSNIYTRGKEDKCCTGSGSIFEARFEESIIHFALDSPLG